MASLTRSNDRIFDDEGCREIKREHATTQNRLCIARKALKEIAGYRREQCEDNEETIAMMKFYAETAIREMGEIKVARQGGYYWVKHEGVWDIAFWVERSMVWLVAGVSDIWTNDRFDQINETRILAPDEVSDE